MLAIDIIVDRFERDGGGDKERESTCVVGAWIGDPERGAAIEVSKDITTSS
jgi:hypothetical protein